MSLSLYDISVPVYRQYLGGLSGVLAKATQHCSTNGIADADITGFRLFEDMQPFSFQVMQSIAHSAGALANLQKESYPRAEGLDTLAGCKTAVDMALAYIDGVKPEELPSDPDAEVALNLPGRTMTFTARNYLTTFAYGNFFFHVTTAYDILRLKGVPIGKRDFLGAVQVKSMG
jgi:hypothetical protein